MKPVHSAADALGGATARNLYAAGISSQAKALAKSGLSAKLLRGFGIGRSAVGNFLSKHPHTTGYVVGAGVPVLVGTALTATGKGINALVEANEQKNLAQLGANRAAEQQAKNVARAAEQSFGMAPYLGAGAGAAIGGGSLAAIAYALAPEKSKRLAAAVAGLVGAAAGGTAGYMYGDDAAKGVKNLIG